MAEGERVLEVEQASGIESDVVRNGYASGAIDRAAAAGAAIALFGCVVLPFVEFRENRIVDGQRLQLWQGAEAWGWILIAVLVLSFGASMIPRRYRGAVLTSVALLSFGALMFSLGASAIRLAPGADTPARVSVAGGAWIVLAGIAVQWFQGQHLAQSRWAAIGSAIAAAVFMVAAWLFGGLSQLSLAVEYRAQAEAFWRLTGAHVLLSVGGTAMAAVIGVPLGIACARSALVRKVAIPAFGVIQTIPSLALYGLLVIPLAAFGLPTLGTVPALIALALYALLPIVRNTFLGVSGVDAASIDAGLGMGMSSRQLLRRVELPLALPLVLEGARAALVLTIGIAAVMAIAGAQNLGTLIFLGWGSIAVDLVLLGAIPMLLLSVIADQGMRAISALAVSPGIRIEREAEASS